MGDSFEGEIQQIAHFVYPGFLSSGDDEIEGVVLDVLSYLPARSAEEILFVLQLSEVATDERVQRVCTGSLAAAIPRGDDAWDALSVGRGSKVEVARKAVEERLRRG